MKKTAQKYNFNLILSLASLAFFALFLLFSPSQNIFYSNAAQPKTEPTNNLNFELPPPASFPIKKTNASLIPDVTAESFIVLDSKSDTVLFSKNKNEKLKIASITKLMTALVAIDIYDKNDVLEIKQNFKEGATIGLTKGEKMTFKNLLKALLIPSANDAAQVLADNSGLDFVSLMNKKAKKIHLDNTIFSNPQGFDDGANSSTALDLSRLGNYSLRYPEISSTVSTSRATITNLSGKVYDLENVNQLLFENPTVRGIKTGYTQEAGECLISLFEKDEKSLIVVVLKSEDRFGESEKLATHSFENFIWGQPQEQSL